MKSLEKIFIEKNIEIIIMLSPILLWDAFIMIALKYYVFSFLMQVMQILFVGVMSFSVLFLSAFVDVVMDDEYKIYEVVIHKANKEGMKKSFCYGILLWLSIVLFSIVGFIGCGIIQCFTILFGKKHESINDKLYNYFNRSINFEDNNHKVYSIR